MNRKLSAVAAALVAIAAFIPSASATGCGWIGDRCCVKGSSKFCFDGSAKCVKGLCVDCSKGGPGCGPLTPPIKPPPTPSCGRLDEPCCKSLPGGTRCLETGTICLSGTCEACGSVNEPSCGGRTPCDKGLVVEGGICVAPPPQCGGPGELCCVSNTGTTKCAGGNVCVGDICEPCGSVGEPVCEGATPCEVGAVPDSAGICVALRCGGLDEKCCPSSTGLSPCDSDDLSCTGAGFCEPCGLLGSVACDDAPVCEAGAEPDVNDICIEQCGITNSACCAESTGLDECDAVNAVCVSGTCLSCGLLGEPACDGSPPCEAGAVPNAKGICAAPVVRCGKEGGVCCASDTGLPPCLDTKNVCTFEHLCAPCGGFKQVVCGGKQPCGKGLVPNTKGFCIPGPLPSSSAGAAATTIGKRTTGGSLPDTKKH